MSELESLLLKQIATQNEQVEILTEQLLVLINLVEALQQQLTDVSQELEKL